MAQISLKVNGRSHTVEADPDSPLLLALIHDLRLNGPKFGCGLSQCGACTVMLNGEPIRSCVTPISEVGDKDILTVEGLGTAEKPHPIQRIFIEEQAIQCGFCISGVMLEGKAFVDKNPRATQEQIAQALNSVLCRCCTHTRMLRALERYGQEVRR